MRALMTVVGKGSLVAAVVEELAGLLTEATREAAPATMDSRE